MPKKPFNRIGPLRKHISQKHRAREGVVVEKTPDDGRGVRELLREQQNLRSDDTLQTALNMAERRVSEPEGEHIKEARIDIAHVAVSVAKHELDLQFKAVSLAVRLIFDYWPREAQIDVIAHLIFKKKNMILVAKTAFGKSTVLQSVSLLERHSVTLVILPLDQIGREQEMKIQNLGVNSFFLNANSNSERSRKSLKSGKYTHIMMSPEPAASNQISLVMETPTLKERLALVFIDETHLVRMWGDHFHLEYARLDTLRRYIRRNVPWFACSATLSKDTLQYLQRHAGFSDDVRVLRTSIDRPQLSFCLGLLPARAGSPYESLRVFVDLEEPRGHDGEKKVLPHDIPETIIFSNSKREVNEARRALQAYVQLHPRFRFRLDAARDCIQVYTRDTYDPDKAAIVDAFCKPGSESALRVNLATEALGVGVDFPDVCRVVQYKLPKGNELAVLWQRGGRACHDQCEGKIVLLVENWAFGKERRKPAKGNNVQEQENEEEGEEGDVEPEDEPGLARGKRGPRTDSERRGLLPDLWYDMVNDEKACMRDLLLDHFGEPLQYRVAKEERRRCCFRCDKTLDYGTVNANTYPTCYLYNEHGNRPGPLARRVNRAVISWAKRTAEKETALSHLAIDQPTLMLSAAEVKVLQARYQHILLRNSLREFLRGWEWMNEYESELIQVIRDAVGTPTAHEASLHDSLNPNFQTALQRPEDSQPHREDEYYQDENSQQAGEIQGDDENRSEGAKKSTSTVRPLKRKVISDITNTAQSSQRRMI
ncbi:hypothetical protein KEM55_002725 [Ascosphaera atra]|nr:hypothetical protein KEM55_002725 [Ascosphaera atra]